MSEQKKRVIPAWLLGLFLLLLAIVLIFDLKTLGSMNDVLSVFAVLVYILVDVSAAYYLFSGFSKSGGIFLRMFTGLFALAQIFLTLFLAKAGYFPALTVLAMLTFGALCIMTFGLDLGKKRSFLLSGIISVTRIAGLILFLGVRKDHPEFQLTGPLSTLMFALALNIAVYAKYREKELRNKNSGN